ncbi:MAG: hypothetical protein AB1798_03075 [Spirochaetota bacterium]
MISSIRQTLITILTLLAAIFLLFGCASVPRLPPFEESIDFLPDDCSMYLKIDVRKNTNIVKKLLVSAMGESLLEFALKRTDTFFAGLKLSGNGNSIFYLVARGNYPKGALELKLGSDKNWKKVKGLLQFWNNSNTGIELAIPQSGMIWVTNESVEKIGQRYQGHSRIKMPEELRREFGVSDIVLFIPKPGKETLLQLPVDSGQFPLKAVWFTFLHTRGEFYTVYGVFEMASEKDAVLLAGLSKLMLVVWMRKEGIGDIKTLPRSVEIKVDGNYVRIGGIVLAEDDLYKIIRLRAEE